MKALVTGGNGFIGKQVVKQLLANSEISYLVSISRSGEKGWYWEGRFETYQRGFRHLRCDVTDRQMVAALMEKYQPNIVFHLAGNPNIKSDENDPTGVTLVNVVGTHNLLVSCPEDSRFVLASSAAVHGDMAGRGDWLKEYDPLAPNSVYGATKVAAEALMGAYISTGRVRGLSLRLVANVGVGQSHGLLKDLLFKLKHNPTLELIGDEPGSRKPFVHVGDTARAIVHLGLNAAANGVVNVSHDDSLTVLDVAEIAMKETGVVKPIRWLGESANWKGDNRVVRIDSSLAWKLGWKPICETSRSSIVRGIEDLWERL